MAMERGLRLTRIRVYPLKGAAGVDLDETGLDEFGIPGDRRWMLVKPDGRFISQRTHPRLCLIQVAPQRPGSALDGRRFTLDTPDSGMFSLGPEPSDVWTEVQVHKDRVPALAGYDGADQWFSDFLGEPCHLVFIPDEVLRPVDPEWAPGHRVGFADGYPLHLVTEESLQDMNHRLSHETSVLRYRPNLVVAGGLPWEEDAWRVLKIGGVTIHLVKPCARCTVITVDQETGARGQEPLRGLIDTCIKNAIV
jgi:uncharacterized protein YcbX